MFRFSVSHKKKQATLHRASCPVVKSSFKVADLKAAFRYYTEINKLTGHLCRKCKP